MCSPLTPLLRLPQRLFLLVLVIVDQESIELIDSLLRVSLLITIKFRCGAKPLPRLAILACIKQGIRVGVTQSSHSQRGHSSRTCGGNRTFQNPSRFLILAKVTPGTGLDDDHFDAQCRIEPHPVGLARQLERIMWTAQSALAVSHYGQVVLRPGHPS